MVVAACGGSSGEAATTVKTTTTEAATTAATTTVARATTTAPPTSFPATTRPPGPLASALLTADDVGPGFLATPGELDDPDDTTPCGTPGVDQVVPPALQDSVDINNLIANLFVSHSVNQYADAATAEKAMAAGQEGLACGKGTSTESDGSTVDFELTEIPLTGLGDQAFAYSGTATTGGQAVAVSFVAMRIGRAVSVLTFLSEPEADGPPADPILLAAETKLATIA